MKTTVNNMDSTFANFLREDNFAISFANSPKGRIALQEYEGISETDKATVFEVWGESPLIEDVAPDIPAGVKPINALELIAQMKTQAQ